MCSVCLQKGKNIATEELSPSVQGLKQVLHGHVYLHFYVLYITVA